ncbi:alpha-mannosidase [Paenibacillus sp. N1-5-1-14]|uniref:alpha-mannosidase n=1 Tax=Paenibacillus radicibacter TaxID=2972488 RepID=UPI002158CB71|nr:alpha-mannosidase [Paenibacillus radicibacter]MCR8641131.1 alpha-mannosidase [Paenibacillus radicibacter]
MPYEKHHVRLVKVMDSLLQKLEEDPEYRTFYLDGQTIILDDYLQVRPEKKDQLTKFIHEGRIIIGPWYILQDAFLTSSEANVRNMLVGHQDAKPYETISKIGYFPDTFGIYGQAPQLMKQSGINNAFFGRGVKPTGFNNTVSDGDFESSFSELEWVGPDGSKVLGILFANWYSNGNEVPVDPEEAKIFWDKKLEDAEKYASTNELLYMNGCDHQPIQLDLPEAIRVARELYPDTEFIHSTFESYLESLDEAMDRELSEVHGELRSQRTDGWGTLVNTASARVYLKQMNQRGQVMLEKVAEPLSTYASFLGQEYPHHLLKYAWKTLMQNHPHDSICGCSVDEVHREMVTRFDKSRDVAEVITEDSLEAIASHIDTSCFMQYVEDSHPFTVWNTTGHERSGTVTVVLDIKRQYFRDEMPFGEMKALIKGIELGNRTVVDSVGQEINCTVTDLGLRFDYDLPDDKFRQPYFARTVQVELEAGAVPANGHKVFALVHASEVKAAAKLAGQTSLIQDTKTMENDHLHVTVEANGSVTLKDKASGQTYSGLCMYEDSGDIGNEYMYRQPNGEMALTTEHLTAEVTVAMDTPYEASLRIVHEWELPKSAEDLLAEEQNDLVWFTSRKSVRSDEMVKVTLTTTITLEKNSRGLKVQSASDNQVSDHRLRMLFPTDINSSNHQADSVFEVVTRDNTPSAEWINPSYCHHQQAFVSVKDETNGITVANKGLCEYEVLRDGRNTIAVTLLRAVGELGDWGVFPTPEAQCLGHATAEMMIIPHGVNTPEQSYADAYQYQIPWMTKQTKLQKGTLAPVHQWLKWEGTGVELSAVKRNEETNDVVVRWFNVTKENSAVTFEPKFNYEGAHFSTILEERLDEVTATDQVINVGVGPAEIKTLVLKK